MRYENGIVPAGAGLRANHPFCGVLLFLLIGFCCFLWVHVNMIQFFAVDPIENAGYTRLIGATEVFTEVCSDGVQAITDHVLVNEATDHVHCVRSLKVVHETVLEVKQRD